MKKFMLASVALAAVSIFSAPIASAQDADDDMPPPEVIATISPVYFEGHAAYWWHDRWHYRDARGGWYRYHAEPAYLHTWRGSHAVTARHYYTTGHAAVVRR